MIDDEAHGSRLFLDISANNVVMFSNNVTFFENDDHHSFPTWNDSVSGPPNAVLCQRR